MEVSREGNDEQSVNIVIHACEYLTDASAGIGRRWMIVVVLLIRLDLTNTWTRSSLRNNIFFLAANSDWAFHEDDSHFPLFEEMLLFQKGRGFLG